MAVGDDVPSTCRRCNARHVSTVVRSEPVCNICFSQYVTTKVIKRMESYRVRGSSSFTSAKKVLLLPLSFGPSSTSLLSILDGHIQSQYDRLGRAAYELHVLHVDMLLDESDRAESRARLDALKQRYPRHTYALLGLEEAVRLKLVDENIKRHPADACTDDEPSASRTLQRLLGSLESASSRSDLIATLLRKLIVHVAKDHSCEAILFGDSTTRLAERTLLETAQGRGFSLPWQVSDGMSPYGILFKYPLRDVLRKEIIIFAKDSIPSYGETILPQESRVNVVASAKDTTIANLLTQYFESVESNYPSIVANVVRTTSKLQPASITGSSACQLCYVPIEPGTDGLHGWAGDQTMVSQTTTGSGRPDALLCYGCTRSLSD